MFFVLPGEFCYLNANTLIHTDTCRFKLKPNIASLLIAVQWGLSFVPKLIVPTFPVWSLSKDPIQQWPVESTRNRPRGQVGGVRDPLFLFLFSLKRVKSQQLRPWRGSTGLA